MHRGRYNRLRVASYLVRSVIEPARDSWNQRGAAQRPVARCEDLVVAYYLTFFCRSGEENGSSALARFLSQLTDTGTPVLIKRLAAGV